MVATKAKYRDLREACIEEALNIVESSGVEKLSLREVARRLGVSHQAPYKHFPSRDHILAEIVSRAYTAFAAHLEKREQSGDPAQELCAMGEAYLNYAQAHPLQYRLMFSTPLPDPKQHPHMMAKAQHAFSLLQTNIEQLHNAIRGPGNYQRTNFDALFIWFALHGLCGLMQTRIADTLELPESVLSSLHEELFLRIDWMLAGEKNN